MIHQAFNPCGKTFLLAGATTAPTAIRVIPTGAGDCNQYHFYNAGAVAVHVGYSGDSAAAALAAAVIPVDGTPQFTISLPAGASRIFTLPKNCYMSPITATSTASVYVTPGRGV